MLNKDKHRKELEDLVIHGHSHKICVYKREHVKECDHFCRNDNKWPCDCDSCNVAFKNWLNAEHKEKIKLTLLEKLILEIAIKDQECFTYIARDEDGRLFLFNNKPSKDICVWVGDSYYGMHLFEDLFRFITWEDSEPYNIQDILNNCEVIEE